MPTQQLAPEPSCRFLRESECHRLTGLSRTQRWRLEQNGRFPKRVRLSERAFGHIEEEVLSWCADRIRERNQSRPTP